MAYAFRKADELVFWPSMVEDMVATRSIRVITCADKTDLLIQRVRVAVEDHPSCSRRHIRDGTRRPELQRHLRKQFVSLINVGTNDL